MDLISSRGPWGRLIDLDTTKNNPSSPYHVRLGEAGGACSPLGAAAPRF